MKIAIIGAGNLGKSIAKGLIVNNAFTTLYLTKRDTEAIKSYEEYSKVTVTSDNQEAVKNSDILIFAVQPQQLERILEEIKDLLTEKHVLISTITGFKIDRIEAIVGADQFIIRAMPNTAIAVGKSMTCMCSNEKGVKRIAIAEAIFNRLGTSIIINENKMQAATVICASGKNCTIAGAVGIAGHLTITAGTHITAMTLVSKSILQPGAYSSGTAMEPHQQWKRNVVRFRQLDELSRRVKCLENIVKQHTEGQPE